MLKWDGAKEIARNECSDMQRLLLLLFPLLFFVVVQLDHRSFLTENTPPRNGRRNARRHDRRAIVGGQCVITMFGASRPSRRLRPGRDYNCNAVVALRDGQARKSAGHWRDGNSTSTWVKAAKYVCIQFAADLMGSLPLLEYCHPRVRSEMAGVSGLVGPLWVNAVANNCAVVVAIEVQWCWRRKWR